MTIDFFDIERKIIIVTGVNGQLGSKYAESFLERGAYVAGIDINNDSPLVFENYHYFKCDITNKNEIQNTLISINDILGAPDALVNNAAIDSPPSSDANQNGPFEDYPEELWDKTIDVNLKGIFLCCQIFGGLMAKQKGGSIVNISSIYGLVSPDQSLYDYKRKKGEEFYKPAPYSVSKSGIFNFSRYLAVYWAKQNVRVNTLTISGVFNNQDKTFLENYEKRIPIGRMANPIDFVGPLIFLLSDSSKYMTGSNLIVDGGWTSI